MSAIRSGACGDPGPGSAHCTDHPGHHYSCYDAGEDVAFNYDHDSEHSCTDQRCPRSATGGEAG